MRAPRFPIWLLPVLAATGAYFLLWQLRGYPWQLALFTAIAIGAFVYVIQRTFDNMRRLIGGEAEWTSAPAESLAAGSGASAKPARSSTERAPTPTPGPGESSHPEPDRSSATASRPRTDNS